MIRLVLFLMLVVVAVVAINSRFGGLGALFRIDISGGGPKLHGKLPGKSWPEVRAFLESLNLPNRSRISGYPDGKRFRLAFKGDIPEGTKQRIRNFLFFGL